MSKMANAARDAALKLVLKLCGARGLEAVRVVDSHGRYNIGLQAYTLLCLEAAMVYAAPGYFCAIGIESRITYDVRPLSVD